MTHPFDPEQFYVDVLKVSGIDRSFGVPDSVLSGFLSYLSARKCTRKHVMLASEGAAVALAIGYHLSTSEIALVYMQNSGLSNALNPLQSLAAKEVFGVPMLLMIGWRGRPGEKDEPQHNLIGPRTLQNLDANGIPHEILPTDLDHAKQVVARLMSRARKESTPVALIVPNKSFSAYKGDPASGLTSAPPQKSSKHRWTSSSWALALTRETAIKNILAALRPRDLTVSSLGGNSRELWMLRKEKGQSIARNFFCIGGMGHAYAVAQGISNGCRKNRVVCIDGDGSFVMHMGNHAVLAPLPEQRVVHIVIYNGKHSSTGNQPLMIGRGDFIAVAEGLPYERIFTVDTAEGLISAVQAVDRSALIVVMVEEGERESLPRPTESPNEQKDAFMRCFGPASKL